MSQGVASKKVIIKRTNQEKPKPLLYRIYASAIKKQEFKGFLRHASHKSIHEFNWGLEHLDISDKDTKQKELIKAFTKHHLMHSSEYFVPPSIPHSCYQLNENDLTFPSTVETFHANNNLARCRFFPLKGSRKVVLVIPHWNGGGEKYDKLCRFLNFLGYSSIWLSLPFHDRRGDNLAPDWSTSMPSTLMVTANIGLTLLAMRQAVQDAISTVSWLEEEGYTHIALQGASIGSCAAFLAAAHDFRVKGLFANLMSSYFGEVVWTGISTSHVKRSIEPHLDLEGLRQVWLLNSPIAFVDSLRMNNPTLKMFVVSGRFDNTFLFYLTEQVITALREGGADFEHRVLPCGHYTLSIFPFRYIDVYYIRKFFGNLFKHVK